MGCVFSGVNFGRENYRGKGGGWFSLPIEAFHQFSWMSTRPPCVVSVVRSDRSQSIPSLGGAGKGVGRLASPGPLTWSRELAFSCCFVGWLGSLGCFVFTFIISAQPRSVAIGKLVQALFCAPRVSLLSAQGRGVGTCPPSCFLSEIFVFLVFLRVLFLVPCVSLHAFVCFCQHQPSHLDM